jgi:NAD(P)-dependent dehydrogenase (short-subunit alcohol dehydrogenase family)
MRGRLDGRGCLVTGATGIAAAGARRFAAEGAAVFVVSLDAGDCAALAEEITAATVAASSRRSVAGASGRRAGDGPLHEVPLAGWEATFALNGHPAFLALREALRAMLAQPARTDGARGAAVLVGSVLAEHPSPERFATHAYAAVKGAEHALTRTTAAYYAPHGIRVNAVAPGLVATPMAARAAADPGSVAYAARKQPLAGGFLDPAAVADVAAFLLSDDARAVTGQVVAVDGGWGVTEAGGENV